MDLAPLSDQVHITVNLILPSPTSVVTVAESGTRVITGLWFFWHTRKQQRKSLYFLERKLTAHSGLRAHQASFDKIVMADVWMESCHQFQAGRSTYLLLSYMGLLSYPQFNLCQKGIISPGIIHRCFFPLPEKVSTIRHSKALGIFSAGRDSYRWEQFMILHPVVLD